MVKCATAVGVDGIEKFENGEIKGSSHLPPNVLKKLCVFSHWTRDPLLATQFPALDSSGTWWQTARFVQSPKAYGHLSLL